jgi:hypothetical protein
MRISLQQLRRIIKEEVLSVKRQKLAESRRRRLREGPLGPPIGSPRAMEMEPPVDPPDDYWGDDEEEDEKVYAPDTDYYDDDYADSDYYTPR